MAILGESLNGAQEDDGALGTLQLGPRSLLRPALAEKAGACQSMGYGVKACPAGTVQVVSALGTKSESTSCCSAGTGKPPSIVRPDYQPVPTKPAETEPEKPGVDTPTAPAPVPGDAAAATAPGVVAKATSWVEEHKLAAAGIGAAILAAGYLLLRDKGRSLAGLGLRQSSFLPAHSRRVHPAYLKWEVVLHDGGSAKHLYLLVREVPPEMPAGKRNFSVYNPDDWRGGGHTGAGKTPRAAIIDYIGGALPTHRSSGPWLEIKGVSGAGRGR